MRQPLSSRFWWKSPLVALLLVGLAGCLFAPGPAAVPPTRRPTFTPKTYDLPNGRQLFTEENGNPAGPLVLFIHGTPGGWGAFAGMLARPNLARRDLLVSVDRLGWGRSAAGGLETSLAAQAQALRVILLAHPNNLPAIVVGHSLGGPIAARLAMDSPDLVGALVIVSGSIDPAQEKVAWYQFIARLPGVYSLVPDDLVKADKEIIPLKSELTKMLPLWGNLRMPVTVIQGEDDELVPAANADFAQRMITHAPLTIERIPDQGHLIPWQRPELMEAAIIHYTNLWQAARAPADQPNQTPAGPIPPPGP
jgi:pimeloyl-ACP methyl ester carboxylesterase